MLEKKIVILLAGINIFALAGILIWFLGADRKPPVITVEENRIYTKETTEEEILAGIRAWDEQDGDVSSSLKIEKIVFKETTGKVLVSCGAQDKSGNIKKYTFSMSGDETVFAERKAESFELAVGEAENMLDDERQESNSEVISTEPTTTDTVEEENTEEETLSEEETSEEETEDEEGEAEQEDDDEDEQEPVEGEQVADEPNQPPVETRPILLFSAQEVKTSKGYNPAWVTVIAQLKDDTDSYEDLLKKIKITGDFDNNTPGNYDVVVTVTDSQGNESSPSAIRIIVE